MKLGSLETENRYIIFNHLNFHLSYNEDNGKFNVVDFSIAPESIDYRKIARSEEREFNSTILPLLFARFNEKNSDSPSKLADANTEVYFTYSVYWTVSFQKVNACRRTKP